MSLSATLQSSNGANCVLGFNSQGLHHHRHHRHHHHPVGGRGHVATAVWDAAALPVVVHNSYGRGAGRCGSCSSLGRAVENRIFLGKHVRLPLHQRSHAWELRIESRISGAPTTKESSGEERTEEERSKLLGVASISIGFNAILLMSVTKPDSLPPSKNSSSTSLLAPSLAVWCAILLNAFIQYIILKRLILVPRSPETPKRVDFTLKQRVADLEENVRESVTTARVLSRQVEKLGVRFRVTRRTLKDPIQEAAACAQKASEVVTILAQREDMLEKELQGLQHALFAMQEQQVKQLGLISTVLSLTMKDQQASLAKSTKKLGSPVNGSASASKTITNKESTQRSVLESKVGCNGLSVPVTATDLKDQGDFGTRREHTSKGASQIDNARSSVLKFQNKTSSSGDSFSKMDFWKDPAVSSSSSTKLATSPVILSQRDISQQSGIGNFFNGRKTIVPEPSAQPKNTHKSVEMMLGSEDPLDLEDELDFVAQPDYESDSWLR